MCSGRALFVDLVEKGEHFVWGVQSTTVADRDVIGRWWAIACEIPGAFATANRSSIHPTKVLPYCRIDGQKRICRCAWPPTAIGHHSLGLWRHPGKMSIDSVLCGALALPSQERCEVAAGLLASLDDEPTQDDFDGVRAAWAHTAWRQRVRHQNDQVTKMGESVVAFRDDVAHQEGNFTAPSSRPSRVQVQPFDPSSLNRVNERTRITARCCDRIQMR